MATESCLYCRGIGRVPLTVDRDITCPQCDGTKLQPLIVVKTTPKPVYCTVTDDGTYQHHDTWVPNADCFTLWTKPDAHAGEVVRLVAEWRERYRLGWSGDHIECANELEAALRRSSAGNQGARDAEGGS